MILQTKRVIESNQRCMKAEVLQFNENEGIAKHWDFSIQSLLEQEVVHLAAPIHRCLHIHLTRHSINWSVEIMHRLRSLMVGETH
jgi:hypothetical protein